MMSDDIFDGQALADKLSKLNSSQQSIESLSRWCITHRKKAKQIVELWDKLFKSAPRDQRVSFLYLSNDILQNSRRKGSEFVNEFWKVLPSALKNVYGTGDESGKKAARRLVDIWEERKVFGSKGQNLKDAVLGKVSPPVPELCSDVKSLDPIKIVKRDAHSLRIKLAVGSMPEKILTSFQSVHDQDVDEQDALNKFKSAILCAGEIERKAEGMSAKENFQGSELVQDIEEQESQLLQCINYLERAEGSRTALVSQLEAALREHEPVLERLHTQLQVAKIQLDKVAALKEKLISLPVYHQRMDSRATEASFSLPEVKSTPAAQSVISAVSKTTEEDEMAAAAAAVVARLAASTSSAQMLNSVFSSLIAEKAASMSTALNLSGFSTGSSMFPPEKRPRLEKPVPTAQAKSSEAGNTSYLTSQQLSSIVPVTSMQPLSQAGYMQSPYVPAAAAPLPPGPPCSSPKNQLVQPVSLMSYGYGATSLPPPPTLTSQVTMGLARPAAAQQQQASQTQMPQQNSNGGYYRPPGIGFHGQNHQPTPPSPAQRQ
ncbi:uncharacterized protein LOC141707857 isoform X2 [Apium graveolens]|uniref:uncharacterized protein LOC141707857 isoform X2 n=1 Tax=Apium graveolens TaxID=4045 RepID=UPI003D798461